MFFIFGSLIFVLFYSPPKKTKKKAKKAILLSITSRPLQRFFGFHPTGVLLQCMISTVTTFFLHFRRFPMHITFSITFCNFHVVFFFLFFSANLAPPLPPRHPKRPLSSASGNLACTLSSSTNSLRSSPATSQIKSETAATNLDERLQKLHAERYKLFLLQLLQYE